MKIRYTSHFVCSALINSKGGNNATAAAGAEEADGEDTSDNANANHQAQGVEQPPENTGGNPLQPATTHVNPGTGMNPLSYPPGSSEDGSPSKGTAIDVEAQRNQKRPQRGFCGRIDCPAWYKWMSYYIPILEWLPSYDCISPC